MDTKIAIWDITSNCNLQCSHCYNQERYWNKSYRELSKDQIDIVIKKLKELEFSGIHLLGGEPLIAKELIYIIEKAKDSKLEISIVSNGTLLTKNLMEKFCELGIESIGISLEGTRAKEHDTVRGNGVFDTVLNNVKDAITIKQQLNSNIVIGMSFTLTEDNLDKSYNIIEFANEIGFDGVSISYLSKEGKARDGFDSKKVSEKNKFLFIDKVIEQYKHIDKDFILNIDARGYLGEYIYKKHGVKISADKVGCKGGHRQFYITADGAFLPCSPSGTSLGSFINSNNFPNLSPANIINSSVKELKFSNYIIEFYNHAHNYKTYKDIIPCEKCRYDCKPCPLLYNKNNYQVDECLYALEQIKSLDKEILQKKYAKNKLLKVDTYENRVEILNLDNANDIFILKDLSYEIWNMLDGNKKGNEVLEELFINYGDDISYNEISMDLIDFINDMYDLKFIDII